MAIHHLKNKKQQNRQEIVQDLLSRKIFRELDYFRSMLFGLMPFFWQ